MSLLSHMRLMPRRKCCSVPLLVGAGDLEKPRTVVSGLAEIDGITVDFVGIVIDPEVEDHHANEALDAAQEMLRSRMNVEAG